MSDSDNLRDNLREAETRMYAAKARPDRAELELTQARAFARLIPRDRLRRIVEREIDNLWDSLVEGTTDFADYWNGPSYQE
jgi:hypothetical protein